MQNMIYLDNAATTFPKPEYVYSTMDAVNRNYAVNAGRGAYQRARKASGLLECLREELLELVNGKLETEVMFASSATIAMNQIIGGLEIREHAVVYISPFEHNAIVRPLHTMYPQAEVILLPLQKETALIDVEKTAYLFSRKPPAYVFLSHVSNVTGYILPIEAVICEAKEYGAVTVVDASQSLGLLPIDMEKLPIDVLVFAGHKTLYGPFGSGGFYKRRGIVLQPYLTGGTGSDSKNPLMPAQEPGRYEAGSPNIIAASGLWAALKELKKYGHGKFPVGMDYFQKHEREKLCSLVNELKEIPEAVIYLPPQEVHIGIVSFNIRGYRCDEVGKILDDDFNIAVRTGYHCAPLIHEMLRDDKYGGTVRASVGRFTTAADITDFGKALSEIAGGL